MLNEDGTYSSIAEVIQQWQEDGIPQEWINRWIQGYESKRREDE
jgi:hypothetical protein